MYLQLYFHGVEHELENKLAFSEKVKETIVSKIMELIRENTYACFFWSLRNVPNLDSYQIVPKSHENTDQRVYNKNIV